MKQYLELLEDILENGEYEQNRTGTGTYSVIGRDMRFDLSKGFPLLTTKKMAVKAIFGELLWFLSGSSDIKELRRFSELSDDDFCIWQANLDELNARRRDFIEEFSREVTPVTFDSFFSEDDLGYVYGQVWRSLKIVLDEELTQEFDQIEQLIDDIKNVAANPSHPAKRRLLVNAWDGYHHSDTDSTSVALPPCHYGFQCFVRNGKLSLKWIQRSVDTFLGLPFNIASYALLLHILAQLTGLKPGELIFSGGDVHIYEDHIEQVKMQLIREPVELCQIELPEFNTLEELLQYTASDFKLVNYISHPAIKGKMS